MFGNDIFRELDRMQKEMDMMFNFAFANENPQLIHYNNQDTRNNNNKYLTKHDNKYRSPNCDICETESSIIVAFELPGVDKKDINLSVSSDSIKLKVEQTNKSEEKNKDGFKYFESNRSYYREFYLPKSVDSEKTKASFKNGMLRVEIPKSKKEKMNRVQIE